MKKTISLLAAGALSISLLAGCGGGGESSSGDQVKIEFFHHKREGMESIDKLIAKFEEENPNIDVEQASPPEPSTVLRTRVSKSDVPDIIGVGGDMTYSDLANSGVFTDVSEEKSLENIQIMRCSHIAAIQTAHFLKQHIFWVGHCHCRADVHAVRQ
jgi:raffinose/stachyose/melibiose transport system substrate-binding protein